MPILKNQPPKKRSNSKADSFLEAFRDLGSDIFPKNQSKELYDTEFDLENQYRQKVRQIEIVRREEKILFTRQEREIKQQVLALQNEISKLARATGDLAKDAQISAMEVSSSVGTYHINFFQKLISIIKSLRLQIRESSFWLQSWNKKAQKKNAYWGQFKKSGSKFMLSADRYMATQAG